jgi:hypothetical protein
MMQAALTVLIDHVQAEIDGTVDVTLAGELFDSQGLDEPPDTAAPHLWKALRVASACAVLDDADIPRAD